jgi:hypothetical protein
LISEKAANFPKGFRARHFGVGGVGGKMETNEIRQLSSIDGFGDE